MLDYKVIDTLTKEECSEILDYSLTYGEPFSYTEDEMTSWDCRRIHHIDFKKKIHQKIIDSGLDLGCEPENLIISLTRYYEGRFLNLHLDLTSNNTVVILLTEDFDDGRFVLSKQPGQYKTDLREDSTKISIKMGEAICFDGSKVYHGVMPVNSGVRCALNVWAIKDGFVYDKLKNEKTLI